MYSQLGQAVNFQKSGLNYLAEEVCAVGIGTGEPEQLTETVKREICRCMCPYSARSRSSS